MNISCRMNNTSDLDMLVAFWNENAGWDCIDQCEWERRFQNTPNGNSSVVLLEDKSNNTLLGHIIFIPSVVVIKEITYKAQRPFALVVAKAYRKQNGYLKLINVIYKMFTYATDYFKQKGVSIIHVMPDVRWSRLFKFFPKVQVSLFPLYSLPLEADVELQTPPGYEMRLLDSRDQQINTLWEESKKLYDCTIQRDSSFLSWKLSLGNYQLLGLFDSSNKLKGLVASIAKYNDKQWLLCDMLTADNDASLKATLQAACFQAYRSKAQLLGAETYNKVSILTTPVIEKIILQLGFKKEAFHFPLLVQLLDEKLTKDMVAPAKWFVCAND